jgi:IS605 OrfB family transposase
MIKKKKQINKNKKLGIDNELQHLTSSISKFSKNVPLYNIFLDSEENVKTNTSFDMYKYNTDIDDINIYNFNIDEVKIPDKIYKCNKVYLKPSPEQSKNLLKMMEGYRLIYNLTISFIKTREYLRKQQIKNEELLHKSSDISKKKINKEVSKENIEVKNVLNNIINEISKEEDIKERKLKRIKKIDNFLKNDNYKMILDYKIIRTYFLKEQIDNISKIYKTPVHTLNNAVHLACTSFKSAITNFKNGNINKFRVKKIKSDKNTILMDIEKNAFSKDGKTFIKTILGKEVLNYSNIKYNINNDCKLHYNRNTKKFILLVPEEVIIKNENINNNYISIDPGLRTFLNCTTNNSYIEIGKNIKTNLKKNILRLDKISLIKNKKIRNRYLMITRQKIKNKINDVHWQIINYLTNTYKTIIIGKWSTKSIISNNDSFFDGVNKRIIQNLSFYSFLEKLKYKCLLKTINLKIVEEHYTSKVCSFCGNLNKDLKGEKIYNCKKCNISINRDYNGSRNIFLKSIKSIN